MRIEIKVPPLISPETQERLLLALERRDDPRLAWTDEDGRLHFPGFDPEQHAAHLAYERRQRQEYSQGYAEGFRAAYQAIRENRDQGDAK